MSRSKNLSLLPQLIHLGIYQSFDWGYYALTDVSV